MYKHQKLRTRSEPLLPMHLAASCSFDTPSSPGSSSQAVPGVSPSSGRRRRIRRSITQDASSLMISSETSALFRNNKSNNKRSTIRRSNTFTKQQTQQALSQLQDDELSLPQYHLMQPKQPQSPLSKRRITGIRHTTSSSTSSSMTTTRKTTAPLARIYSGTAVAGFVLGTIFEVALMGWMACLHVKGTCGDDPLLFQALLALFLVGSWSSIFHYVLWQMDAIFTDLTPPGTIINRFLLYGHFNVGLAVGLGLECKVLHHVLLQRRSHAAILFLTPQCGWGLQSVSVVFGLGCLGLTLIRTYFTPNDDRSTKMIKRKQSVMLSDSPLAATTTNTTPLMSRSDFATGRMV